MANPGPVAAIRQFCLECQGNSSRSVRQCAARGDCVLWRYRFGVRPQTYKDVRRRFFAPRPLKLF